MAKRPSEMKRAVAMAYSGEDGAPRVVAKGSGVTAEAIVSLAQEHGVYVHQSPELVSLLMQVDLDSEIPPELYQAVAELLAWLYSLDQELAERYSGGSASR
ncbi:FlhB domain protein [Citrifermentans bemidjiense Bem]|uniref:FlhB domain protein n=1 Tax=Citrifermentans bemidjiense (strain ATCC BAA-1014 / DSM 16622 / JCM 12645 / Bem) TaxID=404380 RepID=B5EFU9_CITBB|nr:EscU/YscU/HrcU family type III secretion system export apparatus switch protein [Citrifermentans bemidjiense]ACH39414.1 FlhB domain protein [Citrifermentans bemidjiense Bem]